MLEMVLRRVSLAHTIEDIIVTSPDAKIVDMPCTAFCGCYEYRGRRNVLTEVCAAVAAFQKHNKIGNISAIVRITADCPLIRPEIIDKCVNIFLDGAYDLVYNSFEDTGADGSDVEVFGIKALERAHNEAKVPEEREHPTLYMRKHMKTRYVDTPFKGCSVDTQEDLDRVRQIFREGESL
jgi:spore coat polysaccharide biosynthesis protein SpsF (cytidylyltransferase family)